MSDVTPWLVPCVCCTVELCSVRGVARDTSLFLVDSLTYLHGHIKDENISKDSNKPGSLSMANTGMPCMCYNACMYAMHVPLSYTLLASPVRRQTSFGRQSVLHEPQPQCQPRLVLVGRVEAPGLRPDHRGLRDRRGDLQGAHSTPHGHVHTHTSSTHHRHTPRTYHVHTSTFCVDSQPILCNAPCTYTMHTSTTP